MTLKGSVPTQILFSTACAEEAIVGIWRMVQWRATRMLRGAGTFAL